MSVLIKGMEMPEKCDYCPFYDDSVYGDCTITHKMVDYATKPDDCPLIEIPPHGRLIDADALMDVLWRAKEDDPLQYKEDYFTVSDWLWVTPTVIEAEPCNDLAKPNNAPTIIPEDGGE